MLRRFQLLVPIVLILLALPFSAVVAQWQLLHAFPGRLGGICYFPKIAGMERTGFVATDTIGTGREGVMLWRTTDDGAHWQQVPLPSNAAVAVVLTAITFRDANTGWITYSGSTPGCAKTTDGGLTWREVLSVRSADELSSITYQPYSRRLFVTNWEGPCYQSTDDGATWQALAGGVTDKNGIAFASDKTGFMAMGGEAISTSSTSVITGPGLVTTDAGLTWQASAADVEESWSPVGIPGTTSMLQVGDGSGTVFRSDDGGVTWRSVYQFGSDRDLWSRMTGALQVDECGFVYAPTIGDGIYVTTDIGASWTHLPSFPQTTSSMLVDSRFSVRDSVLYVTTPASSADSAQNAQTYLWKLDVAQLPPLIATNVSGATSFCDPLAMAVRYRPFLPCLDHAYSLDRAELSGAESFSLGHGTPLPHFFSTPDSIEVLFTARRTEPDTAYLRLWFSMDGRRIDTTVRLIAGITSGASTVEVRAKSGVSVAGGIAGAVSIDVSAGARDTFFVRRRVSASTPTNLRIFYSPDFLTLSQIEPFAPWTLTSSVLASDHADLRLRDTGSVSDTLVALVFAPAVSRVQYGFVAAQELDSLMQPSTPCDISELTLASGCGNDIIHDVMREVPFTIERIVPNPSSRGAEVVFQRHTELPIRLTVCDALGRMLWQSDLTTERASLPADLPAGSYVVRAESNGFVRSARFIVAR